MYQPESWRSKVQIDIYNYKPLPKFMVHTKRKCILQCFIPGRGITPDVCMTVWDVVDRPIEDTVDVGRGGSNEAFDWTVITTNGWTVDWWWRRRVYEITLHVIYHKNQSTRISTHCTHWISMSSSRSSWFGCMGHPKQDSRFLILCNFLKKCGLSTIRAYISGN